MGILSLLVEIYNLPSLKMNLKFDIEVLAYSLFRYLGTYIYIYIYIDYTQEWLTFWLVIPEWVIITLGDE
jgi:hypothetical protein